MAKTRLNIEDFVCQKLLSDASHRVWSREEIQRYIQRGYDLLVTATRCLWKQDTPASVQDVANQPTYTLPAELFELERATHDQRKLQDFRPEQLLVTDSRWRTQTGDVYGYVVDSDGPYVFRKIRVPSTDDAGRNLTAIEYYRRGAALTADNTLIEIPDRYAKYIAYFAAGEAFARQGKGQNLDMASFYQARFSDGQKLLDSARDKVRRPRRGILGAGRPKPNGPPRPQLPWNFPDRRGRRRR